MMQETYREISQELRHYQLDISFEDGTISLQNDNNEIFGVRKSRFNDKFRVSYLSLDRRLAEITLRDCPQILREWYEELQKLQERVERGETYIQVPAFSMDVDAKGLMELCLYFGAKLVYNGRENKTVN